jgi:hypothetical protein
MLCSVLFIISTDEPSYYSQRMFGSLMGHLGHARKSLERDDQLLQKKQQKETTIRRRRALEIRLRDLDVTRKAWERSEIAPFQDGQLITRYISHNTGRMPFCVALVYFALLCFALRCSASLCVALRCVFLRLLCVALRCLTALFFLRWSALVCIDLRCFALVVLRCSVLSCVFGPRFCSALLSILRYPALVDKRCSALLCFALVCVFGPRCWSAFLVLY